MKSTPSRLVDVQETGRRLGVSVSTVWRMIRRGTLPSIRSGGRRLVPSTALEGRSGLGLAAEIQPFTRDNPIFRLIGAGRSGGHAAGARDKHKVLADAFAFDRHFRQYGRFEILGPDATNVP